MVMRVTRELTGFALDWATAKAHFGVAQVSLFPGLMGRTEPRIVWPGTRTQFQPRKWPNCGELIDTHRIHLSPVPNSTDWYASLGTWATRVRGSTACEAACRALALHAHGENVNIPALLRD